MRLQGNDFYVSSKETGTVVFSVTLTKGTPADLSGWTAHFLIKKDKRDEDEEAVFKNEQSGTAESKITVELNQEVTDRTPGKLYYVLFLTKEDFLIYLKEGNFIITQGGSK